ncbi:MAG: REP-associated tyrosine transposase [Bacteroidales bacterium]
MRPPRLARFGYQGFYRYLLTFCTKGRVARIATSEVATALLSQFRRCGALHRFAITAHCMMPDHVHLLVRAHSADAQLQRFVVCAKQQTGYWYSVQYGEQLWQEGFHDHVLWDDEDELPFVLYVLANPVRRGLASELGEYPLAGSDAYSKDAITQEMRERGWTIEFVPASLSPGLKPRPTTTPACRRS